MIDYDILESFLTNSGLYDKLDFSFNDYNSLIAFLQGKVKINIYCPDCGEKRIYTCIQRDIKIPPVTFTRILNDNLDEKMKKGIVLQEKEKSKKIFEKFIKDNQISNLTYICSKDETHIMNFIILLKDEYIMKIGQFPSYADIDLPQAKKYKSILGEHYYNEYKRAIGLFSCNVGIGSFVYLRRIIERLVYEAFERAKEDGKLTDYKFNYIDKKKHQRRMDGKIRLLKGYLPNIMVKNPEVYGIVSKGIHELSEEECLKHFPVIKNGINLILNDEVARREKLQDEKDYQKSLQPIVKEIKGEV